MGNYIDITLVEEYLGQTFDATTTPTSTTLNKFIDLSEQEINEVTGRNWGEETINSETHDYPKYDILLNKYPVINVTEVKDKDGNILTEGIDSDYIVDGDFIVLNKNNSLPLRIYVTYTAGYTNVRSDAKMLTLLLTLKKLKQSDSSQTSNTTSITVGSISLTKKLGMSTVLNLEDDIEKYYKRLRRLIR